MTSSSTSSSSSSSMLMVVWLLIFLCFGSVVVELEALSFQGPNILVVGASGGTGLRALRGLLDAGYEPWQLIILTRNPSKLQAWNERFGFGIQQGNLDWWLDNDNDNDDENDDENDGNNEKQKQQLLKAVQRCQGVYVHSTSSDTKALDRGEEARAKTLCALLCQAAAQEKDEDDEDDESQETSIIPVVYNSAVGEDGHGVERIQQKHDVEQIFLNETPNKIDFTALRANLFMEELWKGYTRPGILNKGVYSFSTPSDRTIYLTSVRDMGFLAGKILQQKLNGNGKETTHHKRILNVAGDAKSAAEMAAAFAKAQDSPCVHKQSRVLALLARLFFRDLYQIMRFYRKSTETTDIPSLTKEFGPLTDFETFLNETNWGDRNLTYEDLADADRVLKG